MKQNQQDLKQRTKLFSLRIIRLFQSLPKTDEGQIIGKQILRAGASVGANTRASFRGRSKKEFIAKLGIVIEEADECLFWMELLVEAKIIKEEKMRNIMKETEELISIFVSINQKQKSKIETK